MPGKLKFILKWINLDVAIDKHSNLLPKFLIRVCVTKNIQSRKREQKFLPSIFLYTLNFNNRYVKHEYDKEIFGCAKGFN